MDGYIEGIILKICDPKSSYFNGKDGEQKTKECVRFFITRGKETIGFELNRWNTFADELRHIQGFHEGDKVRIQYEVTGSKLYQNRDGEYNNFTRLKVLQIEMVDEEIDFDTPKPKKEKRVKKDVSIPAYSPHLTPLEDMLGIQPPQYAPPKEISVTKPLFDENGEFIKDDDLPF